VETVKNKKVIIGILFVAAVVVGCLIWWNVPYTITDIDPSTVSKIEVFDGNTGKSLTIIDKNDIEYIITNLNSLSLNKEKLSLGYMGYSFKTKIFGDDGALYKEFIINSNAMIRKDPIIYRDSSKSIDYGYIQRLFERMGS
jgi:hypothetical protein